MLNYAKNVLCYWTFLLDIQPFLTVYEETSIT